MYTKEYTTANGGIYKVSVCEDRDNKDSLEVVIRYNGVLVALLYHPKDKVIGLDSRVKEECEDHYNRWPNVEKTLFEFGYEL